MGFEADFPVVLRGYARPTVDALLETVNRLLESADPAQRARAAQQIDEAELEVSLRGYDRRHVDAHLARLRAMLTVG